MKRKLTVLDGKDNKSTLLPQTKVSKVVQSNQTKSISGSTSKITSKVSTTTIKKPTIVVPKQKVQPTIDKKETRANKAEEKHDNKIVLVTTNSVATPPSDIKPKLTKFDVLAHLKRLNKLDLAGWAKIIDKLTKFRQAQQWLAKAENLVKFTDNGDIVYGVLLAKARQVKKNPHHHVFEIGRETREVRTGRRVLNIKNLGIKIYVPERRVPIDSVNKEVCTNLLALVKEVYNNISV